MRLLALEGIDRSVEGFALRLLIELLILAQVSFWDASCILSCEVVGHSIFLVKLPDDYLLKCYRLFLGTAHS